ncbi:PDR/VanB family oxidoreductase [Aestuariivirga sp.]|jgi:ferredoxin-NADP reductase|uniref:PDR/VanB family oxidoreductase n=1 Tax=Aestuariivirga sp. TaxID=2650926 RepID=UPI00378433B1
MSQDTAVGLIPVTVARIDDVTPEIRTLRLSAEDGHYLPGFSGGSHITVGIDLDGDTHLRNAYSLMSSPYDTSHYDIAVRRMESGRGGSRFMHQLRPGDRLGISPPVNLFPIQIHGKLHVFLVGGIGITPVFPQVEELERAGAAFEVHVSCRTPADAVLAHRLADRFGKRVHLRYTRTEGRPDFEAILARRPLGSHAYICGPSTMIADARAAARRLGWSDSHVHFEQFVEQKSGKPFDLVLARSGITLRVPAQVSPLEVLEANGISIPYLCRGGACGQCETRILRTDCAIEHHDVWLSEAAKACNSHFMPCISRADGGTLVVDL